jgi:protein gp37
MARSTIEWTECTWNPVTGCTKVTAGCRHCYAERMAKRLQAMGQPAYARGFELTLHRERLRLPLGWKRPSTIFVNSMSDLFHEDIPVAFIHDVFETMREASWHRFQVLTKRAERLEGLSKDIDWPENVWMGVTVERQDYISRVDRLRSTSAQVKFLSCEPLLGPIAELNLSGIDWVIVGGESGPSARPMNPQWARSLRDQCTGAGVPFFFKQWGGRNKKRAGRHLDGCLWNQTPESQLVVA